MSLKKIPKRRVRRNYGGLKGSTTIAGNAGWGKQGLMWWANKMGLEGYKLHEAQQLATVPGSLVHAMVERYIEEYTLPAGEKIRPLTDYVDFEYSKEDLDLAENSFINFLEWWEQFEVDPVSIEPILINNKDGYGCTPDLIAYVKGALCNLQPTREHGITSIQTNPSKVFTFSGSLAMKNNCLFTTVFGVNCQTRPGKRLSCA
jgi:hypothetical protein